MFPKLLCDPKNQFLWKKYGMQVLTPYNRLKNGRKLVLHLHYSRLLRNLQCSFASGP